MLCMQASRIQACLIFMMAGTTAVSSVTCILLASRYLVDEEHMTRPDRLKPRCGPNAAAEAIYQLNLDYLRK